LRFRAFSSKMVWHDPSGKVREARHPLKTGAGRRKFFYYRKCPARAALSR
jgi:hypothetical protein